MNPRPSPLSRPFGRALLLIFSLGAVGRAEEASVLIRDVVVVRVDEEGRDAGRQDVAVVGERIAAIGPDLAAAGWTSAEMIEGRGRFLTPGLIDSHVHLSMVPGMHEGHEAEFPDVAATARAQMPRSFLYHGFTSVVDLIATPESIARWNAQELAPHAWFCGGVPIQDGYPTQFVPKPARYHASPNFLADPARPEAFPEGFEREAHTPEAIVARIADSGAIGVKTFWEDGFGPATNLPVPSHDLLVALVEAAHARGLPLLVHANAENAQAAGVAAGVDAFVHGLWTWDSPDAPELTAPIKAVLDGIVERGIAWQPTVQVLYGERDLFDPDFLSSEEIRAVVPQAVLDWHASEAGQWMNREYAEVSYVKNLLAEGRWEEIDALPIRHVMQALRYLHEHGGRLLFGTDTPSAPTYANPIGLNGRREMDHWVAAGVPPAEVLRAATLENARFFGLEDEVGEVAVGKRADLLLLREDPRERIEAFDTIEVVVTRGRPINRSDLAAFR